MANAIGAWMAATLITGNDAANSVTGTSGNDVIYGFDPNGPQATATSIEATRVASGLDQPLFAAAPPGDTGRLFIVEKEGAIKVLDLNTGQVLGTPFIDLSAQISAAGEGGLLGLAFDPDFAQNGFFYVDLINLNGDTEVRRYHVSADPNVADAGSATPILAIDQPAGRTNHKGGWIGFGPDGYLYIASGDGGIDANGQNLNTLLGKMLRLDVHGDDFPSDTARNYAIPADNPFVGVSGADEIWALGLRNPFRDGFDRALGTLFIADVGQNKWEEIDIGQSGANYGWSIFEGPERFSPGTPTGGTATSPIHSYNHSVGATVIGGYVYRGEGEGLQGQYFFADFGTGHIYTLRESGSVWIATDQTSLVQTNLGSIDNPASFAEDGFGNFYVIDLDGDVFKLTPKTNSADLGDVLDGGAGDDMLFGGSGDDTLIGGAGADQLSGGAGNDTFRIAGSDGIGDTFAGSSGTDRIQVMGAGPATLSGFSKTASIEQWVGNNQGVLGTSGANILDFSGLTSKAGLPFVDGGEGADTLIGSQFNDELIGSTGGDMLNGGLGNDTLKGGLNNDTLKGGSGHDVLDGGVGADLVDGGDGNDTFRIAGSESSSGRLIGGSGTDSIQVMGAGPATLSGFSPTASIEQWIGNNQGVLGTSAADIFDFSALTSMSGLPYVDGGEGNDTLIGSKFDDTLLGNAGNDTLIGGLGKDVMTGGAGKDTFDFNSISETVKGTSRDRITDFRRSEGDRIDLSTIDADTQKSGNQAFTFIGTKAFSQQAGQLHQIGNVLQGDLNGDGKVDFELYVSLTAMNASDFVL